ncbi:hypothetical protein VKT23_000700 [Stygiomarasmius scandens]|uniref:Transcriptional coactivator p15 (PC4) C-terminal domain-containing protein n=1 Tax=Marasmiellus scandens TaxID=2682957 RepID=A0ABR1K5W0_9AGAR
MVKRKSETSEGASKKIPKTAKKPKYESEEEEAEISAASSSEAEQPVSKSKGKEKANKSGASSSKNDGVKVLKTPEGDKYIDLGKKKRATVRSFKGKVFLDIREFYGNDGDEKPGKKGISLSSEQWQTLKDGMSVIDDLFETQ